VVEPPPDIEYNLSVLIVAILKPPDRSYIIVEPWPMG